MKTIPTLFAAACVVCLAPASHAVFLITDGNAQMRSVLTPFLPDSNNCVADFICDAFTGPDHMLCYNWSYRAPGGGGNRGFSWLDTPVQTVVGNTLTLVYTNAGPNPVGFNRFDARLTVKIFDAVQVNTARCESTLDFQAAASNSGPTVWNIFHHADLDLDGTPGNDIHEVRATLLPSVSGFIATIGQPGGIRFVGINANRWEVNGGNVLRSKILGGTGFDLNNDSGPYIGDGAYAFQWIVTLNPGQSIQFKSAFGVNMPPVAPPCVCDLTFDGAVDVNDLVVILANFGNQVPPFTNGDLDGNGIVNVADLTIFLGCFGTTC